MQTTWITITIPYCDTSSIPSILRHFCSWHITFTLIVPDTIYARIIFRKFHFNNPLLFITLFLLLLIIWLLLEQKSDKITFLTLFPIVLFSRRNMQYFFCSRNCNIHKPFFFINIYILFMR